MLREILDVKPFFNDFYLQTKTTFWWQWVFVTVVGFLVSLLWIEIGERPDIGALEGAIGGLVIGVAQWCLLRQYIFYPVRWVFINVLCWCVLGILGVGALGWVAPQTLNLGWRIFYGIFEGIKIGLVIGFGQWLVLHTEIARPWRWIVGSLIWWTVSLSIGWTFGGILRLMTDFFLGDVIGLMITWFLVAGLTGIALAQLLWE